MASVIFDFDGTLADTFPLVVDVSYRLSPQTKRLSNREIDSLRKLPLLVAMRRLGIPTVHMLEMMFSTRRHLTPRMHEAQPFDGVLEMVKSLHEKGHRMFVLSSNYRENVRIFLQHYQLGNYFKDIEGVHVATSWTKMRALKRLTRRHGLRPADSYYIGNESLDIRAARRAGMRGVAVTWSGHDQAELLAAQPFAIIAKPGELLSTIEKGVAHA